MTQPVSRRLRNPYSLIVLFLFVILNASAQNLQPHPVTQDSLFKGTVPAPFVAAAISSSFSTARTAANVCQTNTFQVHIPVAANEKINLTKVRTLANGNYLAAGTLTLGNGTKEGLLLIIAGDGNIVAQKRIRINNKPTIITDAITSAQGDFYIGGLFDDGTQATFLAGIQMNLSFSWQKVIPVAEMPVKVSVDFASLSELTVAVQLSTSVEVMFMTASSAAVLWKRQVTLPNITELVGFTMASSGKLSLVTNGVFNGLQAVQVTDLSTNGTLVESYLQGNGSDEYKCMAMSPFGSRLNLLGVTNSGGAGLQAFRHNIYGAPARETVHQYPLAFPLSYSTSAALDNAGDALGYFFAASGTLLFIKHPAYYFTSVQDSKQYTVTGASSLAGITRSFDGGFLFGLNTSSAAEIVLLKVDSIGTLPGCGSLAVSLTSTEAINVANVQSSVNSVTEVYTDQNASSQETVVNYNTAFDCQGSFCPPDPIDDTCVATYYKLFRSGSHSDFMTRYAFMGDSKQLVLTKRVDRILGTTHLVSTELKLLDERGNLIKATLLQSGNNIDPGNIYKLNDQEALIVTYTNPGFMLSMVDDNLQVLWNKTISNAIVQSTGLGIGDVKMDSDGNLYIVSNNYGFSSIPKVSIIKMDHQGNTIWSMDYDYAFNSVFMSSACLALTATSIIVVVEANTGNSLQIDKITGALKSSYQFIKNYDGSEYQRYLGYEHGRILYAGQDNNSHLMLGLFDSTAKPLRFRILNEGGSIPRASISKNGFLYTSLNFYDVGINSYREALIKVDTALDIAFMNKYDLPVMRVSHGLGINDGGFIYSGGNIQYGGNASYADPAIIKYSPDGFMGTCTGVYPMAQNFTETAPQAVPVAVTANPRILTYGTGSLSIIPINKPLNIAAVLCVSAPLCDTISVKASDPVCQLNTDHAIEYTKRAGCNLIPRWDFDTSFALLVKTTDKSAIFRFKKTGQQWLRAELNGGCAIFKDSILMEVQKAPSALTLGNDKNLCPGDSVLLDAGNAFAQYTWQDASSNETLLVKQPGKYYVQVENACGDVTADTVLITGAIIPALSIGGDISACVQDTVAVQASTGFNQYNWEATTPMLGLGAQVKLIVSKDTSVIVHAETADGCKASDTALLVVHTPKPIFLGADTSFCKTDSVTLDAGAGYLSYQWSNNSTSRALTVHNAGQYWVEAQDVNLCFARDTFSVILTFATPVVSLGADKDLCTGDIVILDAGNYSSYQWQDGSTNRQLTVSSPGKYWVTVHDNHDCKGSDSFAITKLVALPAGFLKTYDTVCSYSKLTIVPAATYSSYSWSTGSSTSSITVDKAGRYILTVTDADGCKGKDTIDVASKDCLFGIFIPNAFSPNNDQRNDLFKALVYGPTVKFELQVYNRYGQRVFATTDPNKGWDGTINGKLCDNGTYVWQCSFQLVGAEAGYRKGQVLLVR